jgi:hypothetical protein
VAHVLKITVTGDVSCSSKADVAQVKKFTLGQILQVIATDCKEPKITIKEE